MHIHSNARRTASFLSLLLLAAIAAGCGSVKLPYAGQQTAEGALLGAPAIEAALSKHITNGTARGYVVLVAKNGRIEHHWAGGWADVESNRLMRHDDLFRIASMTKPITAAALMILVDQKRVSLDDPVSKYIPEFADAMVGSAKPHRPVNLRDCLTHTAGLGGGQIFSGTLAEQAVVHAKTPLRFQPGSKWEYSPGLNIAGRVIEVVSGMSYEQYLRKNIFDPLKMNDTTFMPTAGQKSRVATVYKPGREPDWLDPVTSGWAMGLGSTLPPQPSGGLFSTASDMATFYQMILNGGQIGGKRSLSEQSAAEMVRIQTGELQTGFTSGNGWGLGFCIVRTPQGVTEALSAGSFGHGGAFGTQSWADPKRNMIYILLIQREGLPNADGSDMRRDFQNASVEAFW